MASKSTNKTIWTLVLAGVFIFLALKLWPSLKKLLAGGGGGSGGAGGVGASGQEPYPYSGSGSGSGGSLSFPSGGGSQGSQSLLQQLNGLLQAGTYQGSSYAQQDYVDSFLNQPLMNLDSQGIPLEPVSNFDFGTSGYTYNDPNAPWNSGDGTSTSDYTSGQGDVQSLDLGTIDGTDPGFQNVS